MNWPCFTLPEAYWFWPPRVGLTELLHLRQKSCWRTTHQTHQTALHSKFCKISLLFMSISWTKRRTHGAIFLDFGHLGPSGPVSNKKASPDLSSTAVKAEFSANLASKTARIARQLLTKPPPWELLKLLGGWWGWVLWQTRNKHSQTWGCSISLSRPAMPTRFLAKNNVQHMLRFTGVSFHITWRISRHD